MKLDSWLLTVEIQLVNFMYNDQETDQTVKGYPKVNAVLFSFFCMQIFFSIVSKQDTKCTTACMCITELSPSASVSAE